MSTMTFSPTDGAVSSGAATGRRTHALTLGSVSSNGGGATGAGPRTALTVVATIKPNHVEPLTTRLATIDRDECRNAKCPLPGLDDVHTVRWVILPDAVRESGVTVRPSLVFWTVFDCCLEDHIRALTENPASRARLDEVYGHCEGYPTGGGAGDVAAFLERHSVDRDWGACYDGVLGRTLRQTHDEDELRQRLKGFLDEGDWTGCPPSHIYLAAKAWIERTQPDLAWALEPPPKREPPSLRRLAWIGGLGAAVLVYTAPTLVGLFLGTLLIAAVAWLYLLHRDELRADENYVAPPRAWFAAHDAAIGTRENEDSGINRLTILTDVHPGWVRALTMRAVLWVVGLRARRATDGKLQGVETIHFAQWRLVDGGRRLLFMSNYDGRADDYFRDFSDNAAPGVNAIWSNTVGFPPTALLIGWGSRDLPRFQQSARAYQIPTDVWYFGYDRRSFTTKRINENTRIREGLSRFLTPPEVKEWLELVYADAT